MTFGAGSYIGVAPAHHLINSEKRGYQQIASYIELRNMLSSETLLPPLRGWAASPDFLVYPAKLLSIHKPIAILDLGSGSTSLVSGNYVASAGAVVYSIDHDATYAEKTLQYLQLAGLSSSVNVTVLPLIDTDQSVFYDLTAVSASGTTFDFVIFSTVPPPFQVRLEGAYCQNGRICLEIAASSSLTITSATTNSR